MPVLNKHFGLTAYKARYLVDKEQSGMRLDQFLQIYLQEFSREAIKEKIKNGDVLIENRQGIPKSACRIYHKQIIEMTIHNTRHEDEYWNGEKLTLPAKPDILFEDDNLIVIAKPPFMSAHPTGRHLFYCATVYFESIHHQTIHPIHRLDRETSGILLLGKNPSVARLLGNFFETGRVLKCYFFIASFNSNSPRERVFMAEERLEQTETGIDRMCMKHHPVNSSKGKKASTKFIVLMQNQTHAVGLAFPKTGRQHQIRVHAMLHGLPLLGDKLYLGGFSAFQRFKDVKATIEDHQLMEMPRQALHAIALKIAYQKKDFFRCPIPNDLTKWISEKTNFNIKELEKKIDETITEEFSLEMERMNYCGRQGQSKDRKRNYQKFQSMA